MAVQNARPSPFNQLTTIADWELYTDAIGGADGINGVPGDTSFNPTLDAVGRNAQLDAGQAVIRGQVWTCDTTQQVPIPAASGLNRIDRLVLRLNRAGASAATVVQPVVITGTPASTPSEPSLIRTPTGFWDLPVSSWLSASTGTIGPVVDERQYTGTIVLLGTSTYHPPVTTPCLLIETDTGSLMRWTGTLWAPVVQKVTSWANFNPLQNNWSVPSGGWANYRKFLDTNELQISAWIKSPNSSPVNDQAVAVFPSGFRPHSTHGIPVQADVVNNTPGGEGVGFTLGSGGTLWSNGFGVGANVYIEVRMALDQ